VLGKRERPLLGKKRAHAPHGTERYSDPRRGKERGSFPSAREQSWTCGGRGLFINLAGRGGKGGGRSVSELISLYFREEGVFWIGGKKELDISHGEREERGLSHSLEGDYIEIFREWEEKKKKKRFRAVRKGEIKKKEEGCITHVEKGEGTSAALEKEGEEIQQKGKNPPYPKRGRKKEEKILYFSKARGSFLLKKKARASGGASWKNGTP